MAISAVETAIMVGGLSALGAALYSIGIPKDSVIQYEAAVKADSFLVMAHGTPAERRSSAPPAPLALMCMQTRKRKSRRIISSMRWLNEAEP
jgi:hypothetical protein